MREVDPPVRWLKSYWDEEDILYYLEADVEGFVLRQVELQGPMRLPLAAAALSELPDVRTDGAEAVLDYADQYGGVAEGPISSWDRDFPHEDISAEEFEDAWRSARVELDRTDRVVLEMPAEIELKPGAPPMPDGWRGVADFGEVWSAADAHLLPPGSELPMGKPLCYGCEARFVIEESSRRVVLRFWALGTPRRTMEPGAEFTLRNGRMARATGRLLPSR